MGNETPGRRIGANVLAALGACVVCCSFVTSCGDGYIGGVYANVGDSGGSGGSMGSGGSGGSGGGHACDPGYVCVLREQGQGPFLAWFGPPGKAPAPPTRALEKQFKGHGDLVAPGCPACTCGTLSHTCTLPTSMTAYDVWPCPVGQQGQPFDAASSWDGTCDASNPIPAPNNVHSLLVDAIDVTESCIPVPAAPMPVPAHWDTEARAFGFFPVPCGAPTVTDGHVCVPPLMGLDDPPGGFHLCMLRDLDVGCHGDHFTEKHVFYEEDFDDQRTCSPCTCTPPAVKGTCTSFLSVYQNADTSCNGPPVQPGQGISSVMSTCIQINPPDQPLGSKSAPAPQYTPAPGNPTCQPGGGELQGEVKKPLPTTFCCLPSKQAYPPPNHP